jgi:hypothetical protein
MDEDRAGTVREWSSRSVEGHAGLRQLASEEFSGVIETDRGSIRTFMTNGTVVGVDGADVDDLDGMAMTAYTAPDDAIPLLFAMQARGGEPRAQYYTEETPLTEVNQTLESGGFTGYVELSENVLSGDYYVVYHAGRSSSVAFVGSSSRLLTGDEAFERAADEVGIYDVVDVDVSVIEIPGDTPDAAAGDGGVAAESTAGNADRAGAAGAGNTAETPAGESGSGPTAGESGGGPTDGEPAADVAAGEGGAVDAAEPDTETDEAPGDATDGSVSESGDGAVDTGPSSGTGEAERGDDRAADVGGASSGSSGPYGTGEEIRVGAGLGTDDEDDGGDATTPDTAGANDAGAEPSNPGATDDAVGDESPDGPRPGTTEGEPSGADAATEPDRPPESETGGEDAGGGDTGTPTEGEADGGATTDGTAGEAAAVDESAAEPAADAPDRSSGSPQGDSGPTEAPRADAETATGAGGETATGTGGGAATDDGTAADDGGETARASDGRTERASGGRADVADTGGPTRERLQAELQETRETLERVRAERDDYRADAERLRERVETLESRIGALEAEAEDDSEEAGIDLDAARSLSPDEALAGTNLFVRYESKADPTLEDAHDGGGDPDTVNRNLRLEHHTRFEAADVAVDGERFESFLTSSFEYRFVEWVVRRLLYELRSTGGDRGMEKLYDAIPAVDRIHFDGEVQVGGEEGESDDARQFDVIFRDRMGGPLLVANLHESRDPTEAGAVTTLIEDARTVAVSAETIGAAVAVTTSYYDPQALKAASNATGGGFLSRSNKESYVKMDRKRGFHLCLIEARDGEFNLKLPDR